MQVQAEPVERLGMIPGFKFGFGDVRVVVQVIQGNSTAFAHGKQDVLTSECGDELAAAFLWDTIFRLDDRRDTGGCRSDRYQPVAAEA